MDLPRKISTGHATSSPWHKKTWHWVSRTPCGSKIRYLDEVHFLWLHHWWKIGIFQCKRKTICKWWLHYFMWFRDIFQHHLWGLQPSMVGWWLGITLSNKNWGWSYSYSIMRRIPTKTLLLDKPVISSPKWRVGVEQETISISASCLKGSTVKHENSWASLKIVPLYSQKLWISMITSVKLEAKKRVKSSDRRLTSWSVPLDNHPTGVSTNKKNVWVTLKIPQIGLQPAPVWYFLSGVYPPVPKTMTYWNSPIYRWFSHPKLHLATFVEG